MEGENGLHKISELKYSFFERDIYFIRLVFLIHGVLRIKKPIYIDLPSYLSKINYFVPIFRTPEPPCIQGRF